MIDTRKAWGPSTRPTAQSRRPGRPFLPKPRACRLSRRSGHPRSSKRRSEERAHPCPRATHTHRTSSRPHLGHPPPATSGCTGHLQRHSAPSLPLSRPLSQLLCFPFGGNSITLYYTPPHTKHQVASPDKERCSRSTAEELGYFC